MERPIESINKELLKGFVQSLILVLHLLSWNTLVHAKKLNFIVKISSSTYLKDILQCKSKTGVTSTKCYRLSHKEVGEGVSHGIVLKFWNFKVLQLSLWTFKNTGDTQPSNCHLNFWILQEIFWWVYHSENVDKNFANTKIYHQKETENTRDIGREGTITLKLYWRGNSQYSLCSWHGIFI